MCEIVELLPTFSIILFDDYVCMGKTKQVIILIIIIKCTRRSLGNYLSIVLVRVGDRGLCWGSGPSKGQLDLMSSLRRGGDPLQAPGRHHKRMSPTWTSTIGSFID